MYKVKFGGKKGKTIQLVESPDLVAIRTRGNQELESTPLSSRSRELVVGAPEVAAFPEAGVTVRRMSEEAGLESTVSRRDMARASLKEEENIRFAGRVLQDAKSGEVMLYTENFFIKFKDEVPEATCLALIEQYNLTIKSKLPFAANSYFVQAGEGTGLKVFEIAEALLKEKPVEFCHPELVQERRFKTIHPLQWHLGKTTINGKAVDAHVNIEAAWEHTRGKGITIAIIDDGVDVDHPEFSGRIVHPFDATMNVEDARPKDPGDSHGTACAGMACASGLQDGASGTAPEATLMPIRLRSGLGSMAEAMAFSWAADHGADVISCSWGPTDGEWWNPADPVHKRMTALPDSTRLALEYALGKGRNGKGCVVLFAAGNGNEDIKYDGYSSYSGVIAVAACNDSSRRSVYSDYGNGIWVSFPSGDFGWKPFKHAAPVSEGLRTTDRLQKAGYDTGDYANSFGGTSGACPGMAGIVALMLAVNPLLTPVAIKNLLRNACQKIDKKEGEYDAQGHSIWYGYGRIDAGLAVAAARESAVPTAASGPAITGIARFTKIGEQPLQTDGGFTGDVEPAQRLLGFSLQLESVAKTVRLRYRVNVPGLGIVQNRTQGGFAATATARQRIIGFAIELTGTGSKKYDVVYSARLKGAAVPAYAENGMFCGSETNSGKTVEAISIQLKKRK
ncbi:MAG TPA: S8 family serine peptidase [Saprospiraceae bacterium]|nr:S8 family serine peptidase [Saprospiraceae bacterium]HPI08604.1 S8 family serine peptidase [Saprospiraceae bacterium]